MEAILKFKMEATKNTEYSYWCVCVFFVLFSCCFCFVVFVVVFVVVFLLLFF